MFPGTLPTTAILTKKIKKLEEKNKIKLKKTNMDRVKLVVLPTATNIYQATKCHCLKKCQKKHCFGPK